ncbi:hypothetical protein [Lachnoclostridium sp. An14]|uniref:hypothetical protein n=1 Tax=Lachnoclostridium sp. An14 TaxID=1965562 RepID=UPI00117B62CC|nr:hypothetical protein [Lachnoclostridium sp. An14]
MRASTPIYTGAIRGFHSKMWGYRFDSEERFREQLKALTGLLLEKGVPRLEQMANRGKPGPYA